MFFKVGNIYFDILPYHTIFGMQFTFLIAVVHFNFCFHVAYSIKIVYIMVLP